MSPSIRVDDEVYDHLQRHARPFVDTPNSVLRRLLDIEPHSGEVQAQKMQGASRQPSSRGAKRRHRPSKRAGTLSRRAQTGTILPAEEYDIPLLAVIDERGGSAPARQVIDALGKRLGARLTPLDRERLASGGVRWENRAQFVRLRLVEAGLLAKNTPRGTWSLTDLGRAKLAESK